MANEAKRARAASLAGVADATTGIARLHWLREAIELYAELGDAETLARLRALYEHAALEAQSELKTISSTTVIERSKIEEWVDSLRLGKGPSVAGFLVLPHEIGLWVAPEAVRTERLAEDRSTFSSLFPRVSLEADGRLQPEPDPETDAEAHERARDVAYFGQRSILRAGVLAVTLTELRHRGAWSAPLIATAVRTVDADLAEACYPGLVQFEAGDYWSAAHVFVPQLERALRVLGRRVGADQTRFTPSQGLRWATLDPILEDDGIRRSLGEDVASGIGWLFTDRHGPNFRNNTAHGALATDGNPSAAALLALLAILSVTRAAAIAALKDDTD